MSFTGTSFRALRAQKQSLTIKPLSTTPCRLSSTLAPPYTAETAHQKVKKAQNLWNTKDPAKIALAYTPNTIWRNRSTFLRGHSAITSFLASKFSTEHNYRLRKELFSFSSHKIAVQFWYEWQDANAGMKWKRTYGIEHWSYADGGDGRMEKRQMSGNDVEIGEEERWFRGGVDVDDESVTRQMTEEHW